MGNKTILCMQKLETLKISPPPQATWGNPPPGFKKNAINIRCREVVCIGDEMHYVIALSRCVTDVEIININP